RSSVPSSSQQDTPDNHFHSIDLNNTSIPAGPGPYHEMLPDNLFEGDLPRNKSSESNILAASEKLVIESLSMMREEVERREFGVSRKGKEKIVEEGPRRRPTTRSDARKLMADALKLNLVSLRCLLKKWKRKTRRKSQEKQSQRIQRRLRKQNPRRRVLQENGRDHRDLIPNKGVEKEVNMQEIIDNLRKQVVLAGRVFDMGIIILPGMDSLYDMVEIQSWMHLFNRESPILYEEEVSEFYYNIQFKEDGSILTKLNNIAMHLDEFLLGKILSVPREGTRSVNGKTCSIEFVSLVSKLPTTKVARVFKKVMKSEYRLVFEFVNNTLLARTEKRTSATSADLFMMEMLCRFEPLNLPGLMLEHMYKTVIERKGIHGM
ncbi:hypothetical protein EJD97_002312, partial [Solanum chilense]